MSSKEPAGHLADDEHLSPLVGVYSLLAVALATGGPPSIWWIVIVAILAFISCVLSLQAAASRHSASSSTLPASARAPRTNARANSR